MKLLFIFILISCLSGCSNEQSINTDSIGEISVLVNEQRLIFQPGSLVHTKLIEWLNQNKDGWEAYYATATLGKYVIKGKLFTLNVGNEFAILNYEVLPGEYKQFSKTIKIQDFDFIVK